MKKHIRNIWVILKTKFINTPNPLYKNAVKINPSCKYKNITVGNFVIDKNGEIYRVIEFGVVIAYNILYCTVSYVSIDNEDKGKHEIKWKRFSKMFRKIGFNDFYYRKIVKETL